MPLLGSEHECEELVVKQRLSSWSLERLQAEGYCITNMKGYWNSGETSRGFGVGRFVANFVLGPGIALPTEHRFQCVP